MARRVTRFGDRIFDRLRHPTAFELSEDQVVDGEVRSLRDDRYAVLVTYRRDGTPVPSPVWVAVDAAGVAYVKTASNAGKVKRLRHDDRVLIAPSTMRGRPTGPPIRGTARVLPPEEWPHAEQTLASAYGIGRRVAERLLGGEEAEYLSITTRPRR